jgi:hypothetical protein
MPAPAAVGCYGGGTFSALSEGMDGEETLDRVCSQLSAALTELRTVREKLREFDGTVAAVSLGRELSRTQRHLETVSETVAIVVQHLPPVAKAITPRPTDARAHR